MMADISIMERERERVPHNPKEKKRCENVHLNADNSKQNKFIFRQNPFVQALYISRNFVQIIWSICNSNTAQAAGSHVINRGLEKILQRDLQEESLSKKNTDKC
jgi:hypothetical protein